MGETGFVEKVYMDAAGRVDIHGFADRHNSRTSVIPDHVGTVVHASSFGIELSTGKQYNAQRSSFRLLIVVCLHAVPRVAGLILLVHFQLSEETYTTRDSLGGYEAFDMVRSDAFLLIPLFVCRLLLPSHGCEVELLFVAVCRYP